MRHKESCPINSCPGYLVDKLCNLGWSYRKIARTLSVTHKCVSDVRARRTFKQIRRDTHV